MYFASVLYQSDIDIGYWLYATLVKLLFVRNACSMQLMPN